VRDKNGQLIAFFDGQRVTGEANHKWKSRRESEIKLGKRNSPPNASWIVAEVLARFGVKVRYSSELDKR